MADDEDNRPRPMQYPALPQTLSLWALTGHSIRARPLFWKSRDGSPTNRPGSPGCKAKTSSNRTPMSFRIFAFAASAIGRGFRSKRRGFLLILLVMCAIGAMVWNAAQDRDLVVEPFSGAERRCANRIDGQRPGRPRDRTASARCRPTPIPSPKASGPTRASAPMRCESKFRETGISIGEFDSYLRQWLGHESMVTGALVHAAKGYTATIRYADQTGGTVESADLDSLTTKAAEQLYRAARPLRYADYLTSHGRFDEALRIIPAAGAYDGGARERASAYVSGATLLYQQGDPRGQMEKGRHRHRARSFQRRRLVRTRRRRLQRSASRSRHQGGEKTSLR